MSKMEIRLAGSGGQGVILASVILSEAALIAGKYTTQSQSYGPEARGGACKAETLISDIPIGFTKVQHPDFLLVLTEAALVKYGKNVPENCIIMMDDGLQPLPEMDPARVIRLPILRTAKEKVGRAGTANVVAIGCINSVLKLVDHEAIRRAVTMHVPAGTEEINLKALEEGIALIKAAEEKVTAEKAAEEKARTEKTAAEKATEENAIEEKAAAEKTIEEKAIEEKAAAGKNMEEKATIVNITEKKAAAPEKKVRASEKKAMASEKKVMMKKEAVLV